MVLSIQAIQQFLLFLGIQIVLPQADFAGLHLHLPGKLTYTHEGITAGMQCRRTAHGVAQLDTVAG